MELIGAPVATRAMRTSWLDPRERRQELGGARPSRACRAPGELPAFGARTSEVTEMPTRLGAGGGRSGSRPV